MQQPLVNLPFVAAFKLWEERYRADPANFMSREMQDAEPTDTLADLQSKYFVALLNELAGGFSWDQIGVPAEKRVRCTCATMIERVRCTCATMIEPLCQKHGDKAICPDCAAAREEPRWVDSLVPCSTCGSSGLVPR